VLLSSSSSFFCVLIFSYIFFLFFNVLIPTIVRSRYDCTDVYQTRQFLIRPKCVYGQFKICVTVSVTVSVTFTVLEALCLSLVLVFKIISMICDVSWDWLWPPCHRTRFNLLPFTIPAWVFGKLLTWGKNWHHLVCDSGTLLCDKGLENIVLMGGFDFMWL
jgi:hypothetical protein